jgi:hypothetical protein
MARMPACGATSAALARVNRFGVVAFSCLVSLLNAWHAWAATHEWPFLSMQRSGVTR